MKLTATMMLSVDGVHEGPGGPQENQPGFDRGGWVAPYRDEESTYRPAGRATFGNAG